MHYVAHVIHPVVPEDELYSYIEKVMAPFYEELEVLPYKVYYSDKEIAKSQKWYSEKGFNDGDDPMAVVPQSWNGHVSFTDEHGTYYMSTTNPESHWDWWVIGGRWDDYWSDDISTEIVSSDKTKSNTVSVGYALARAMSGKYDWMESGPYAYLTLDGEFIPRNVYNPDGEGYEDNDPNSVFPPNEKYGYWDYLRSVEPIADLAITVVDYHC